MTVIIKNFIKVSRGDSASYHTSYKQACTRYGWDYREARDRDRIPKEYNGYKIERITTGGSIDAEHLLHFLSLEPEVVVNGGVIFLGHPELEYTIKYYLETLGSGPVKFRFESITHADGANICLNQYEKSALYEYLRQYSVKLNKYTYEQQAK